MSAAWDPAVVADILTHTCGQFRKQEEEVVEEDLKNGLKVTHVYAMPHVSAAKQDGSVAMHDLHFVEVGVHKEGIRERAAELRDQLDAYPEPERLAGGPSYIEIGGALGSQELALLLFAAGAELGWWEIVTPAKLGITGPAADQLAGTGMVMTNGYRPERVEAG